MDEAQYRQELADGGYGEPNLVEWEANTVNDTHTHDFSAAILVLDGEITVTTDDGEVTCRAGDTFSLAAGVPHAERIGADGVRFLAGRK